MKKKYDAVVKTGSYTNQAGETKGRFENVGSVMEGDNGLFMILKATFNPAGARQEGKDSIIVSFYEPKSDGQSPHQEAKQNAYQPQPELDDTIPF